MKPRPFVPDASMPSLRTLLSNLPDHPDAYTNDEVFGPNLAAPEAPAARAAEALADDSGEHVRTTMVPVAAPRTGAGTTRMFGFAIAAALAAGVVLSSYHASTPVPARATSVGIGEAGFISWAALRDEAMNARRAVSVVVPAPARKPPRARVRALETATAAAATQPDNAAEPEASEAESGAAALLAAALAPAEEPKRFDTSAASAAIAGAIGRAAACGDGSVSGSARISVTFAHSGRATAAVIDGSSPLAGTAVGGCIARSMQSLTVPPYEGELVTVRRWITIR